MDHINFVNRIDELLIEGHKPREIIKRNGTCRRAEFYKMNET